MHRRSTQGLKLKKIRDQRLSSQQDAKSYYQHVIPDQSPIVSSILNKPMKASMQENPYSKGLSDEKMNYPFN
jgi:hypothetical protein